MSNYSIFKIWIKLATQFCCFICIFFCIHISPIILHHVCYISIQIQLWISHSPSIQSDSDLLIFYIYNVPVPISSNTVLYSVLHLCCFLFPFTMIASGLHIESNYENEINLYIFQDKHLSHSESAGLWVAKRDSLSFTLSWIITRAAGVNAIIEKPAA